MTAIRTQTWILISIVVLLFFLVPGINHGLWSPDEPRVAGTCAEMARTRDFVVPHLNGKPFLEKPPLYYAAGAVAGSLLGEDKDVPYRLVSLLISALTIIITFLMGTKEFYEWVHDNPLIEMHTVDYTNNPFLIAQNRKMISINSALEVDLLGQVCADSLGPRQFSGVGGQVDFIRGAKMSEGGKAIIALPSTAKDSSRIVPVLKKGAAVTTSRNDVDYVVTEFGIAPLFGKTRRERMKALIQIAHPKFQEDLAQKSFEIYNVKI